MQRTTTHTTHAPRFNRSRGRSSKTSQTSSITGTRRATFESLEDRRMMSVVPAGATVFLPGTTAAAQPALAGVVIHDALLPFAVNDAAGHTIFKGHLQDRVVRENASGNLDFYQGVRADAGFPLAAFLDYASRSNFAGYPIDANYRTDGIGSPTIKPENASRSLDSKTVRFNFNLDRINPGQFSLFYFARTTAKSFDLHGSTALGFGQGPVPSSGSGSVKLTTAEPTVALGSISGVKFNDLNGDGKREAGEPGLPNVRIYLDTNHNGAFDVGERSTLTGPTGQYSFPVLPAGAYQVREVKPAGWRQTAPATGFYNVALPAGGAITGRDFGNTRTVRITGIVFNDANGNGVRNLGEGGLSGFRVYLDANNNGAFDAAEKNFITGASGAYDFNGLPAGVYHVRVAPRLFYHPTSPAGGQYAIGLPSGAVASNLNFGERFSLVPIPQLPIATTPSIPIPPPGPFLQPIIAI